MPKDDVVLGTAGLALSGIGHRFGDRRILEDIELTVAPRELVCLVGPSGCGKTTLLRLAAGLEEVQEGRIAIDGRTVAEAGREVPPEQRGVGLVFQDSALFPHLNVAENVAFGLNAQPSAERIARTKAVLEQVGMTSYADAYPHTLSGGQQQRVALARALAPRPRVMLLDEPFSGLDARLREQVRDDTLHVLKQSDAATLMVTHDPEEAMFMADRIAVMRQGRIIQTGRPVDIYRRPQSAFVASFFGQVNEIASVVRDGKVATPFGLLPAPGHPEGALVDVLIRPEALRLQPIDLDREPQCPGRVLASRLLGRTSWVHLCVGDQGASAHMHWHARVPGLFLPEDGDVLEVAVDPAQAFVFLRSDPK